MRKKEMSTAGNSTTADITKQDDYTMQAQLLSILYEGKKSRAELARRMGATDRTVRKVVADLRMQGYPICSSSHSDGYWLGSPEEIRQTIAEYKARAVQCLGIACALEVQVQLDNQIEIGDNDVK